MVTRGGSAGRAPALSFPVHSETVPPPEYNVLDVANPDLRVACAGAFLSYLGRLKQDLSASDLSEDVKKWYNLLYDAEIFKYTAIMTDRLTTVAQPGAQAATLTGAPASTSSVRASIPDKFTGDANKLELFLSNMETYFNVMSTPLDKQAGVLRLNLQDSVIQTLTHTNSSVEGFWGNKDLIIHSLKEFYTQPNKRTAAQTKLKALKMQGYKLTKYFNTFLTLCGESGYNPDDQSHKSAFHLGLNTLSTRGGLRSQVLNMVHDPTKSTKDLFLSADEFLQNEHGVGYENKSCPADSNEHRVTGGRTNGDDDGWTVINRRRQQRPQPYTRGNGGHNNNNGNKNANQNSNTANNDATNSSYNPRGNANAGGRGRGSGGRGGNNNGGRGRGGNNTNITCNRCNRLGHRSNQCNARYEFDQSAPRKQGAELPYNTCAKVLSGEWPADGHYMEKRGNTSTSNVSVDNLNVNPPAAAAAAAATVSAAAAEAAAPSVQAGVQAAAVSIVDMDLDALDCTSPTKPQNNK